MKKITLLILTVTISLFSFGQQNLKKVQSVLHPSVECNLANLGTLVTNAAEPTSDAVINWTVKDDNTDKFFIRVNWASAPDDADINTSIDQLINKASGDDFNVIAAGKGSNVSYGGCIPSTGNKVSMKYVEFTGTYVNGETYTAVFNIYSAAGATDNTITLNVTVDNSLSSKDELSTFNFSYAPNPANNTLNLSAAKNISNIDFYNLLGQKALSTQVNGTRKALDISSLQSGMYVMQVTIDETIGTYKIIKK